MTQHASSPGLASFNFTSASGTVWNLTTLRPLSPSVRLVRAADGAIYALKLLPVSGEKTRLLLTREAETWKKASQCPAVLKLHDVYFNTDTAFFIMEYCAGSILTAPRAERSALRAIAAVASALQFVIDSAEQRAHASLSLDHILFDSTGSLKLGGFGLTRAKRVASTKRNLSERNDIRALTALLYELCYGKRFDSANPAIPDAPQITGLTKDLLRSVLFVPMAKVPDLLVYRYDLAAARKLVPSCTPPLKPIVNTRPQENLELDIDSSRGLPPSSVVTDNQSTLPIEANTSPPSVTASHSASNTVEAERDNGFSDLHSLAGVNEAVRRIATPTLVPEGNNEVNRLLEACLPMQQLPDRIFEALGQLHISSSKGNPVVAFKVATLIHRLLAEGPATLTSSALQKLDFLKWIETSWSRTRISNHGGRVHAYTYCFAAGEISWYAAMLRCRAFVHGTFAKVFSTHWLARGNGLPTLQANRRDAFRSILDILERCGALVRKVATSKDPAANVKQFAIPLLIQEICKTYYALCWLFATAPMNMKTLLECELGVAHTAARNANNIVHSAPDVAAQCAPEFLLTLEETVPDQLDPEALVSLLKKLKRKKKKKKSSAAAVNLSKSKRVENSQDEEVLAESETGLPEDSETKSPLTTPEEAKDKRREISPPTEVTQRKKVPNTRKAFRQPPVVPLDDIEQLPNSQPQNALQPIRKSSPDISSLRKLSISVRKGLPSDGQEPVQNGYKMPHDKYKAVDGRQIRSRSRSRSPLRRSALSGSEDDSEQDGSDSLSESSDASSDVQGSGGEGTYVKQITNRKQDRKGRAKKKSNKKRKNDSESGSEDEEPRRKPKGKKKGKAKRKSKDENIEDTSADPSAKEKKVGRKKHANEKAIPFDKKPPKRKTWAKPQGNDEEYEGGSKEALAAAASGKKTPSMNLKFEVAPYEVQFAQQIGSGGFGVVFKAKFRGETVAVKKIHAHALMNSASIVEFQSEVAVLCTLRHPNIIGFVGACTRPPNLMIITEFMERGTLFDVLHQSNERVTWPMRKKFALDTCKGMRYLHDSKLLHRDLKSSNLLLDKDYNCKVGDFGLTRISKGSAAVQMTGQCGTFQYMAVEVLANKPYSEKADVFSFGILLWEIVARKLPYFGMQPMQVGMAVLNQGLRPTIPRECPPSLAKLMRNCWDSDPSQRPSFRELVPILEALPE